MGYLFRDLYIFRFHSLIFLGGVHGPHEELTAGYPKNDDLESMYLRLLEYGLFFRIHVDFRDYTSLWFMMKGTATDKGNMSI